MKAFIVILLQRHIIKNSCKISCVVGTILNLANQGSNLLSGSDISWIQAILNYCIPYYVASYSAAKNEIDRNKVVDGKN